TRCEIARCWVNCSSGLRHFDGGRKSDSESLPIPKGLRPTARGCEERATLGQRIRKTKPQRGFDFGGRAPPAQPRLGLPLGLLFCASYRVARASQPGFDAESRWD